MNKAAIEKILPTTLTSYDLLKAAAVIIMIIDHLGYYLFLEEPWFRAIGRIGFPVWFFLVGYSRGRDFSVSLFIGAALLVASNFLCGMSIFPLNALVTIILIRLILDPLMAMALKNPVFMLLTIVAVTGLIVPSFSVSEYGTLGLLLAMFGYVVRHKPVFAGVGPDMVAKGMALYCLLTFLVIQQLFFMFVQESLLFLVVGTSVVMWILLNFRAVDFLRLTNTVSGGVTAAVQFMGRNTMEIYVIHLLVLKIVGVMVDPARFDWFMWEWYSLTGT